jgi:hypothetical protein
MQNNDDLGMLILNQHPAKLPVRSLRLVESDTIRVYDNNPHRPVRMVGEHAYTDWPHIKRRSFVDEIGPYKEGVKMWETELDFSRRVNVQTRYFVADIAGTNVFEHIGADLSFNTGPWKTRMAKRIKKLPLGNALLEWCRAHKPHS